MKYDIPLKLDTKNSMSILLNQITPGSKILEFGCANGRMTRYLKLAMKCDVYIVEKEQDAYLSAKKYAVDGICGDIMDFSWKDRWSDFDFIIFADVLEHLFDPFIVLCFCKNILKDKGKILISLPNIAHNDVLIRLFQNKFHYTEIGLLDDTHIHFFAQESLYPLAHQTGFVITWMDYVSLPTGGTEQFWNENVEIPAEFMNLLCERNGGEIYQFLFSLEKEEFGKEILMPFSKAHSLESKIYPDYGNGFSEEIALPVFAEHVGQSHYRYRNEFIPSDSIRRLRFDPTESQGCILYKADASTLNQRATAFYNNSINLGNKVFLRGNDPEIIFEFSCPVKEIILLDIEFELYSVKAMNCIFDEFKKQNELKKAERNIK